MRGWFSFLVLIALTTFANVAVSEVETTTIYTGGGWRLTRVVEGGSGQVSCSLLATATSTQSFALIGYETGKARVVGYDQTSNLPRKRAKLIVYVKVKGDFKTWRFNGQSNRRTVAAPLLKENGVAFLKDIGSGSGVVIEISGEDFQVAVPYERGRQAVEKFLVCWSEIASR